MIISHITTHFEMKIIRAEFHVCTPSSFKAAKKDKLTERQADRIALHSLAFFVKYNLIIMQEASDALSKLQTVTLFRPIRSLQCSW